MKNMKNKLLLFLLLLTITCLQSVASAQDIPGRYLMDGDRNRVIVITQIQDDIYRIEEPSGSWPWRGCGFLFGRMLFGIVRFRRNGTSMMLRGDWRSDGSIVISYVFMTDERGNLEDAIGPGHGRVDRHIWYRTG